MAIKYDNCKDCHSICVHAGKDRKFVCINGVSCKITTEKPHTNADRIRSMTDEELATFISEITDECEQNTECNQHCYGCDIEYCVHESCLKWLRKPAEGE